MAKPKYYTVSYRLVGKTTWRQKGYLNFTVAMRAAHTMSDSDTNNAEVVVYDPTAQPFYHWRRAGVLGLGLGRNNA